MSALAEVYLKLETLEKMVSILKKTSRTGIALTVSIDDKSSKHGSNVTMFVAQSKEERDQKKDKFMVGYGKVFWTTGTVVKGVKPEGGEAGPDTSPPLGDDDDDLPF